MAGYRTSSTGRGRRWISSMNKTSPCWRSVSSAARSPARTRAGPEVMRSPTPISAATMPASDVLPRPGRPGEQQMVDGLLAPAGRLEDDLEVLGQLRLSEELLEMPGPEPGLVGELGRVGERVHRAAPGRRRSPPRPGVARAVGARARRRSPTAPRAGRSPCPRQLPQRLAQQLLDRALVRAALEGPPDLVGAVAELGQRGPHLAARLGRTPVAARARRRRRRRAARGATAGRGRGAPRSCGRRRARCTARRGPRRARPGSGRRGAGRPARPGPAPGPPRARRAAPRSTAAPRWWRSRRGRWRPRGRGCGRAARPASPDRPPRRAASATP